jgi:hypothetical protein
MDRPDINTVQQAIEFLRRIDVEVIGVWHGWVLKGISLAREYEMTLDSNAELIEHARYEREQCAKLCEMSDFDSLDEFLACFFPASFERDMAAERRSKARKSQRSGKGTRGVRP